MFTLFKKELASFFTSLIGYLTIIVFLVLTGLMLWVFKSDFNILDYGFASMEGLFVIGPFLYLFLIPAITMRMFAEEKKNGTMELLLTKPLSEMKLIWAKFLAGVVLVFISLLPTVVCSLLTISAWTLMTLAMYGTSVSSLLRLSSLTMLLMFTTVTSVARMVPSAPTRWLRRYGLSLRMMLLVFTATCPAPMLIRV